MNVENYHISRENLAHIIKVFLLGKTNLKDELICDGPPGEEHLIWCRWKDVIDLRKPIVNNLIDNKMTNELGKTLQRIHKECDL